MKTLHLLLTSTIFWVGLHVSAQSAEVLPASNEDVAIIIGNKNYLDQDIPEVTYAHNDAHAMKEFVTDMLHIREENIIFLEDASQAKMQTAFGRKGNYRGKAFQYVKPDVSNLYVFYSGHGVPGKTDGKSYLLPVDADIETADINGYPTDVLYENLAQVEAQSVTIFLDACFSGNSHAGTLIQQASGAQILPKQTKIPQAGNMTVITAASKDQLASWDSESKHGLFTEYLLRALYGEADKNKDGEVRLAEVGTFLKEDMRYKARRAFNRDQTPSVNGNNDQIISAAVNGIYPKRPKLSSTETEMETIKTITQSEVDPVDQVMYALKNANVRTAPDVYSSRVATLSKGDGIHVAGKVQGKPWYAVGRSDELFGYVYEPLLGTARIEQAELESKSLSELKKRLVRLEEQTKLGSNNVLPQPPVRTEPATSGDIIGRRSSDEEQGPEPNWAFEEDPYQNIEQNLKIMGAILAKQSFIKRSRKAGVETRLNYNWIRIEAERCAISASISLKHDKEVKQDGSLKSLNIHDREIKAVFWRELDSKKRKLTARDENQKIIHRVSIYRYGPFNFKDKNDRRLFKQKAGELRALCPKPRPMQSQYEDVRMAPQSRGDYSRPLRRPPPPPRFGRPPPPRR